MWIVGYLVGNGVILTLIDSRKRIDLDKVLTDNKQRWFQHLLIVENWVFFTHNSSRKLDKREIER